MGHPRIVGIVSIFLAWPLVARGGPEVLVPGYTLTKVSPDPTAASFSSYEGITQLTFKPGDDAHVYAARLLFPGSVPTSEVTRYDYAAATGQLSNPLDIATGLPAALGLAFHGDDLYISTNHNIFASNATGGLERLRPVGGGLYGDAVEFVNNIPAGEHQVDQLQIRGDTLTVGIGTRTDAGTPGQESVYNGTIARIADVTRSDYSAAGANNLALSAVATDTDPGKLHVFASGFRNPFGLRVDASGQVSATDNGQDPPAPTQDFLYKGVHQGDRGVFPPPGAGATIAPFARFGYDTSADGFDTIPAGPHQGWTLVALFSRAGPGSGSLTGQQLVAVDPNDGGHLVSFIADAANPTVFNPLEVIQDPFGRLLIADYGPSTYSDPFNSMADVGVYLVSAAVPEPSAIALLGLGIALAAARAWSRRAGGAGP